ncbi:MAG: ABC transporter permease [Acidimicrobiia bacterium]
MTSLGSILGVATVVAIIGLSGTASNQISVRFDELLATRVFVEPASPSISSEILNVDLEAVQEIEGVTGVARATVLGERTASLRPVNGRQISFTPVVVNDEFANATEAEVVGGNNWDPKVVAETGAPIVLLGESVVLELNLPPYDGPLTLWIEGRAVTVAGYIRAGGAEPRVNGWVLVPESSYDSLIWGAGGASSILVRVTPGSGAAVADVIPYALDPEHPDRFLAIAPPEPEILRANVEGDTRVAFLAAGVISLVVGGVAIASATLTSVAERTEQYGVRRALGAGRRDIARLVLLETTLLGASGGVVGCILGLILVLAFSLSLAWVPVFDARLVPLAILLGVCVGAVAGLIPSLKAAMIEPIQAIRRA